MDGRKGDSTILAPFTKSVPFLSLARAVVSLSASSNRPTTTAPRPLARSLSLSFTLRSPDTRTTRTTHAACDAVPPKYGGRRLRDSRLPKLPSFSVSRSSKMTICDLYLYYYFTVTGRPRKSFGAI